MIETQRLILRGLKKSDAAAMFAYSHNPNVGRNAGWEEHHSVRESRLAIKYFFLGKKDSFGIFLKDEEKLIGTISLTKDMKRLNDRCRSLGYSLSEEYWGKGIMTEAAHAVINYGFDDPEIRLISAYCYPDNERSKRVLQKCGFTYEGRQLQSELMPDGTVRDNDCFVLFRPEI